MVKQRIFTRILILTALIDVTRPKMKASLQQVLQADRIEDLQKLGAFAEIKRTVETQLMLKLGVNGWAALFSKLHVLKATLSSNSSSINLARHEKNFSEARRALSKSLGFRVAAKNPSELDGLIRTCSLYFFDNHFDPHRRFEEKKLKNFINSSKLEGIKIPFPDEKASLESILAKHRR
ncbi:DUF2559 family protein [Pseudomonas syringae pv. actinidiae]|uniref:Uncharacterized protein n=3 Tax=Pseudomonas syringae TaxID=317 RepID=A0AAU8XA95_PSESF|nr:YhfG family protein [Pseudomonas syringae]ATV15544.1 hypothetical protein CT122_00410 [Pseudomonas syringae pv. actinidiae]AYL18513.1 hypothetical protein D9N00_31740 [Pseudomonas syringae pv. actinidiae]AYL78620.1 hypothetical protein CN228_00475 [Pseudomonas syringae pv. actinidiae str. Shaanxi_M228]EPM51564.1 hypothetical protein A262_22193 [Pseudomonas syringae pv. actinidiae ICMP 19073]EPM86797.1 hypothetical protein A3SM_06539 [Pseudomonas syringae pv. actinidiae ICMP 18886]